MDPRGSDPGPLTIAAHITPIPGRASLHGCCFSSGVARPLPEHTPDHAPHADRTAPRIEGSGRGKARSPSPGHTGAWLGLLLTSTGCRPPHELSLSRRT